MSKNVYWKDIRQSFTKSKGRFFSIFSLMAIGSLALVALKVTTPNMQRTAQDFISRNKTMDLAVMADYGLSQDDVHELSQLKDAKVEFGYLTDVTIKETNKAVRIYSATDSLSQYDLVSGSMPSQSDQIALAQVMSKDYKIGDHISFTLAGDDQVLKTTAFTVTGFVNSSEIWDNQAMGQTTVGTGELTGYAVTPASAFDSDIYMIARIAYDDLEHVNYYDKAYDDKLAEHQNQLDDLLSDNGAHRLASLKADAQEEIDKGYADIADSEAELASAAQQLADAQNEISDGQAQIDAAWAQVASGEAELAAAASELAQGSSQLSSSYAELAAAKAQLDSSKATLDNTAASLASAHSQLAGAKTSLDSNKAQLDAAGAELTAAKSTLDGSKAELDAAAAEISAGHSQLDSARAELQTQKEALIAAGLDPETVPEIQVAEEQIAQKEEVLKQAQTSYETGLAQYEAGLATYSSNKAAYDEGLAQYNQGLATYNSNLAAYEDGLAQYQAGLAQYNQGLAAYESGLAQYNSGLATYLAGVEDYNQGLAKLEQSKSTIAQNQAKIDQAIAELKTSQADYDSKRVEAKSKISDAKADLVQAQADVDALEEPSYTSYSRATIPGSDGYGTYTAGANSISAVGNIFPVVLYLVAAMVTLTTMTRFVDEERNNAGIFKALGYTNRQIIAKFVIYGFVASMAGSLVGILLGNFYLSPLIGDILTSSTVIGQSTIYFYPSWTLIALLLGFVSAVLPAYIVARRDLLNEKPAQLLQAKPPVAGSKILLERLTFIWNRLSFTHKVTARNIFRYKQRMLMTIFGVAGSVALLFAGLGIRSSISGIADTQFGDIVSYDLIVAGKKGASDKESKEVTDLISSDQVSKSLAIRFDSLTESIDSIDDQQSISLLVTDSDELTDYIKLRDRASGRQLSLTNSGAIISEKIAKLYGVSKGDKIRVTIEDKAVDVVISDITEMYAGHFLYMTDDYYEQLAGQDFEKNSYLVRLKDRSSKQVQAQAADFLKLDGVAAVVQNTSLENTVHTVADSLQSIMVILVILSIMLGVVILYNLTNINVAERIRELSTIKVLGFHNKEVTMYIYRETIVLSLIGIVTGLAGGLLLHKVILDMIGSSAIMFQPSVSLDVYLTPIFAIVGILAVLGWLVNYRLRHVDMLEALKSVE